MQELSIASEVLRICRQHLNGEPARIKRVIVAVGELSAVDLDLLRFAWEEVTQGTRHEGARLEIEWHSAKQICDTCGEIPEHVPGSWLRLCPRCTRSLRMEGGNELDVMNVSFESLQPKAILVA